MEKRMKIVFGKPEYLPSREDGVLVVYSYKLMNSQKENFKDEETKYSTIKVLIDRHLANSLGFQIWSPIEFYYYGLIKLLLPDVIDEIKRKYCIKTLRESNEIELLTSNYPVERIHRVDQLPEVDGYEESI